MAQHLETLDTSKRFPLLSNNLNLSWNFLKYFMFIVHNSNTFWTRFTFILSNFWAKHYRCTTSYDTILSKNTSIFTKYILISIQIHLCKIWVKKESWYQIWKGTTQMLSITSLMTALVILLWTTTMWRYIIWWHRVKLLKQLKSFLMLTDFWINEYEGMFYCKKLMFLFARLVKIIENK